MAVRRPAGQPGRPGYFNLAWLLPVFLTVIGLLGWNLRPRVQPVPKGPISGSRQRHYRYIAVNTYGPDGGHAHPRIDLQPAGPIHSELGVLSCTVAVLPAAVVVPPNLAAGPQPWTCSLWDVDLQPLTAARLGAAGPLQHMFRPRLSRPVVAPGPPRLAAPPHPIRLHLCPPAVQLDATVSNEGRQNVLLYMVNPLVLCPAGSSPPGCQCSQLELDRVGLTQCADWWYRDLAAVGQPHPTVVADFPTQWRRVAQAHRVAAIQWSTLLRTQRVASIDALYLGHAAIPAVVPQLLGARVLPREVPLNWSNRTVGLPHNSDLQPGQARSLAMLSHHYTCQWSRHRMHCVRAAGHGPGHPTVPLLAPATAPGLAPALHHWDYIEIGTADFETLAQKHGHNETVHGLSVDVVAEYLHSLPSGGQKRQLNAAISDVDGTLDVYVVNPLILCPRDVPPSRCTCDQGELRRLGLDLCLDWWYKGCTSVGKPHPTVVTRLGE
eukprot:gene10136-1831_t